jgi:hypothetical protein
MARRFGSSPNRLRLLGAPGPSTDPGAGLESNCQKLLSHDEEAGANGLRCGLGAAGGTQFL